MFTGFSDATVDFMWGIRFNNEKPWVEAHKDIYLKEFYEPMRELGSEMYDHISSRLPDYGLILRVARIYRDARRLHGRGPYKDNLWLSIERPAELWTANTCFWFGVHPEGWTYGMGYWMPKPATMAKLRRRIDADPKPMEELMRRLAGQEEFQLEMEQYKKPRAAAPNELVAPWYQAKNFSIGHEEPWTEELYSHDIVERMKQGFAFLLPYYDYFLSLEGESEENL